MDTVEVLSIFDFRSYTISQKINLALTTRKNGLHFIPRERSQLIRDAFESVVARVPHTPLLGDTGPGLHWQMPLNFLSLTKKGWEEAVYRPFLSELKSREQ
jgi:hypothetical protein